MEKRGQAFSINFLLGVILSVVVFGVIIIVLFQISWKEDAGEQVCHESVILRGTLPNTFGAQDLVPLKCNTKKLCLHNENIFGDKECSDFGGLEDVSYVRVKEDTEIEKTITKEILSCWEMMGQGKVSLYSQHWAGYGVGGVYPTCIICTRIAFDDNLDVDILKDVDVQEYMATRKAPDYDGTYAQYFAGEKAGISYADKLKDFKLPGVSSDSWTAGSGLSVNEAVEQGDTGAGGDEVYKQELAVLFMQISAPSAGDVFSKTIDSFAVGGTVSFVNAPIMTFKVLTSKTLWFAMAIGLVAQQVNAAHNRYIAAGYCGDVEYGQDTSRGCSVVRTVPYNLEDIKKYCAVIESIP